MVCKGAASDGGMIFVCTRNSDRPLCRCGNVATKLCDYPLRGKKCDVPLCRSCAVDTTKLDFLTKGQIEALGCEWYETRGGNRKLKPKSGDTFDLCPVHARMMGWK